MFWSHYDCYQATLRPTSSRCTPGWTPPWRSWRGWWRRSTQRPADEAPTSTSPWSTLTCGRALGVRQEMLARQYLARKWVFRIKQFLSGRCNNYVSPGSRWHQDAPELQVCYRRLHRHCSDSTHGSHGPNGLRTERIRRGPEERQRQRLRWWSWRWRWWIQRR